MDADRLAPERSLVPAYAAAKVTDVYILLYRGDREALSGSLDRIQRAASVILKAVTVGE